MVLTLCVNGVIVLMGQNCAHRGLKVAPINKTTGPAASAALLRGRKALKIKGGSNGSTRGSKTRASSSLPDSDPCLGLAEAGFHRRDEVIMYPSPPHCDRGGPDGPITACREGLYVVERVGPTIRTK